MSTDEVKYDRSRPRPSLQPLYHYKLPNVPGKSTVALLVTFPPDGATPPHRHAGASVSVYVLEGHTINKMNDDPIHTFEQGQTFFEGPGCHHRVSANASKTKQLKLIANFVVDTEILEQKGYEGLVELDEEYLDVTFP